MNIASVIEPSDMKLVPITFQFLKPLIRENIFFTNRLATITKYQSQRVTVYPPAKKLSLIL